jgi:4-amino-4-deoxy-L-arabinose transferase-like glycosyltransferase
MKSEKGVAMKGSIRLVVGFLLVFGAVGGLDNPENPVMAGIVLAAVGLGLMYSGSKAMERV